MLLENKVNFQSILQLNGNSVESAFMLNIIFLIIQTLDIMEDEN